MCLCVALRRIAETEAVLRCRLIFLILVYFPVRYCRRRVYFACFTEGVYVPPPPPPPLPFEGGVTVSRFRGKRKRSGLATSRSQYA